MFEYHDRRLSREPIFLRVAKKVTLISGQKLLDLIHGQPLVDGGVKLVLLRTKQRR
jgi:hypothetical protein